MLWVDDPDQGIPCLFEQLKEELAITVCAQDQLLLKLAPLVPLDELVDGLEDGALIILFQLWLTVTGHDPIAKAAAYDVVDAVFMAALRELVPRLEGPADLAQAIMLDPGSDGGLPALRFVARGEGRNPESPVLVEADGALAVQVASVLGGPPPGLHLVYAEACANQLLSFRELLELVLEVHLVDGIKVLSDPVAGAGPVAVKPSGLQCFHGGRLAQGREVLRSGTRYESPDVREDCHGRGVDLGSRHLVVCSRVLLWAALLVGGGALGLTAQGCNPRDPDRAFRPFRDYRLSFGASGAQGPQLDVYLPMNFGRQERAWVVQALGEMWNAFRVDAWLSLGFSSALNVRRPRRLYVHNVPRLEGGPWRSSVLIWQQGDEAHIVMGADWTVGEAYHAFVHLWIDDDPWHGNGSTFWQNVFNRGAGIVRLILVRR